jgi:hypothetical protein
MPVTSSPRRAFWAAPARSFFSSSSVGNPESFRLVSESGAALFEQDRTRSGIRHPLSPSQGQARDSRKAPR